MNGLKWPKPSLYCIYSIYLFLGPVGVFLTGVGGVNYLVTKECLRIRGSTSLHVDSHNPHEILESTFGEHSWFIPLEKTCQHGISCCLDKPKSEKTWENYDEPWDLDGFGSKQDIARRCLQQAS